ncbi:LysR family transcriptional regulator [Sphingomonas sp. LT1P40]|uniref:LysR family transcriptional regulator n=1 Tax=Alteristakelama amylovorans TaxID=3096166 RepID=UPI002FCB18EE
MTRGSFDLNLLRALDMLLRHRNVTRAAETLFVTQQAMSGSLRRLRDHFDDPLLVRVGRSLELSPLARSLEGPVREAILRADAAISTRPHFDPATARMSVRIAMSDYATFVILPRLLRLLTRRAPHIVCHFEALNRHSLEAIELGEIDLCITAGNWALYPTYTPIPDIRVQPLFHEGFICAVDGAKRDPGELLTTAQYVRMRHNTAVFGQGIETVVETAWRTHRLPINVVASAPNFSSLLYMLPGTELIATVQRRLAHALAPSLGLKLLECPIEIEPLEETLIWHDRTTNDPGHSFLRDQLIEIAQRIDAEAPHSPVTTVSDT